MSSTSHSKRKKRQLMERDGLRGGDEYGYWDTWTYRCYLCGRQFPPDQLQIEHKLPKARGGTDHLSNLGLSCEPCNIAKANMTVEEYLEWRELPENNKLYSMKWQGRQRLNKAKVGLTHAIGDHWPERQDQAQVD